MYCTQIPLGNSFSEINTIAQTQQRTCSLGCFSHWLGHVDRVGQTEDGWQHVADTCKHILWYTLKIHKTLKSEHKEQAMRIAWLLVGLLPNCEEKNVRKWSIQFVFPSFSNTQHMLILHTCLKREVSRLELFSLIKQIVTKTR